MAIDIELEGELELVSNEGGHCSDTIRIDGKSLDAVIREKCGAEHGPTEMILLGPCRLTLHIELDQTAPDL